MELTVLGATGGVGGHLVRQALGAGHRVTAVVRDPARLPADLRGAAGLDLVRADLVAADPGTALDGAVTGADAVLSALGPRSRDDARARVVSRATAATVAAMRRTGVRRLVVVSAVPVPTVPSPARPAAVERDPGDGWFTHAVLVPLVRAFLRETYRDLAETEDLVRASGLDWTIVRPPRLLDAPGGRPYRTETTRNLRGGTSIPRADVADCMLRAATGGAWVGEAVRVAR
jgi:uncharacterized protein YbjT (DUF2867 family)